MVYKDIFKSIAQYYRPNRKIVILEIGVGRRAHSTKSFLEGLAYRKLDNLGENTGKLFSIDINEKNGKQRHVEVRPARIAELMGMDKDWTFIEGDSAKVEWKDKIDVLFIDGDHSYEGVKTDFEKYEPFVKRGGLILMHDVYPRRFGVRRFWTEIKYPKVKIELDKVGLGIIQKI